MNPPSQPGKSPFKDCDFDWPNLFEEADEMLLSSMMIYPFTKLREMARQGLLKDSEAILSLPMTATDAMQLVESNSDELKQHLGDDAELLVSSMKAVHQRYEDLAKKQRESFSILEKAKSYISGQETTHHAEVVAYGDTYCQNELVYAVGIDHGRKRLTVVFRGSVTKQDFLADAAIDMTCEKNPFADLFGQDALIKYHSGFYAYLLDEAKLTKSGANKYEEVMAQVLPLMKTNPTFKLYVTGHSLGGALATLFAFKVATSDLPIPKPVTCISIASPKVGDDSFRRAFQLMEDQGKLRHLRIANAKDPVTQVPPASMGALITKISPAALIYSHIRRGGTHNEIYYHCGIKLKLFGPDEDRKWRITYSNGSLSQDRLLPGSVRQVSDHYCTEYNTRLALVKSDLCEIYLNDLYSIKAASGNNTLQILNKNHN